MDGDAQEVQEFTDHFSPLLQAELPDAGSRYLAAAASFLLLQLSMWEYAIVAVNDARLAELILSRDHKLLGLDARPLPEPVRAMKLPTGEGRPRLELQGVEPSTAFRLERPPSVFLFAIVCGGDRAQAAVQAWTDGGRASSLALLVKAPLSDFDGLTATLAELEHRVAGWLNVEEADGHANVVALMILGPGRDEI